MALIRLDPRTAPRPPRPACRPSWLIVANGISRSPAGPIAATCQSGSVIAHGCAASASRAGRPQSEPAGCQETAEARLRPLPSIEDDRGLRAGARDHERVDPGPLGGEREVRRRQGVAEPAGQRAERDDGELGRGRQRAADQRAEREDQRRTRGCQRVEPRPASRAPGSRCPGRRRRGSGGGPSAKASRKPFASRHRPGGSDRDSRQARSCLTTSENRCRPLGSRANVPEEVKRIRQKNPRRGRGSHPGSNLRKLRSNQHPHGDSNPGPLAENQVS